MIDPAVASQPSRHPIIREILLARGVPEKKVRPMLRRKLFGSAALELDDFRLIVGGDPYTAEWTFVLDFSHGRSWPAVEEAMFDYRNNPLRSRSWFWLSLGGTPTAVRARLVYQRLHSSGTKLPSS